MTKSQLGAVWASDELAQTVEDLQATLNEGPALDAHQFGAPALEPFLDIASGRWPFFSAEAVDLGIGAVFSFPLQIGVIRLGALNLFRREPGPLTGDQLADALVLADVATQDLLDLQAEGSLHWILSDRFPERARVHQATGMVAAQMGSDMTTALACIRGHAFAHELSIFEVAEEVLGRRLRLNTSLR
ncbi:MAG: ANTAR domain-containing protein [Actinomycetota bacterium]